MRILITGGTRGIGKAIAKECLTDGHDVLIVSKQVESVNDARAELSGIGAGELVAQICDVSDINQIDNLARACVESNMPIDVLVLNAGVFFEGSITDSKANDFHETLKVNFESLYYFVRSFVGQLKASKFARIIIIGSTASYEPYAVGALYGVSKWAARGFAVNLRQELMSENIGVTFVAPGGTLTDLWKDDEVEPGRLMEPRDIGIVVACCLRLSPQAVVEEVIVRPMLGDIHE